MNGYLSLDIPVIDSPLIKIGVIKKPVINSRLIGGTSNSLNNIKHNPSLDCEYYATMDLCSQAQIYENADNIL
ncbi:MAG: hypothetical protein JKY14_10505, partial [Paraglaciecola sp.]|nr:hypothetical protein [Paraglaciecola sp.]